MALLVLAVGSMAVQLHPQFLSSQWHFRYIMKATQFVLQIASLSLSIRRLFLYSILIFAGMIPVTHWAVTNGGLTSPLVMVSISLPMQCYLVLLILPPVMISLFL